MSEAEDEKTEAEAITPIYKITRIVLTVALVMFIWYLFAPSPGHNLGPPPLHRMR